MDTSPQEQPARRRAVDPVPPVTEHYSGLPDRDRMITDLKERLLGGGDLALYGRPGMGKTGLAARLYGDPQIRVYFSDVIWLNVGDHPDLLSLLGRLAERIGVSDRELALLTSIDARKQAIRGAVGRRRFLVIADDVCFLEHAQQVKLDAPAIVQVITTYLEGIAADFSSTGATHVSRLNKGDALRLMCNYVPALVDAEQSAAEALIQWVEGSPLALTLLSQYLAALNSAEDRPLARSLERLETKKAELEGQRQAPRRVQPRLAAFDAGDCNPSENVALSLLAAIAVCAEDLGPEGTQAVRALSLLPVKPGTFSWGAAKAICGGTEATATGILTRLSERCLLEVYDPGTDAARCALHRAVKVYGRDARQPVDSASSPDLEPVRQMVRYYAGLVSRATAPQNRNYRAIEAEQANILVALREAQTLVGEQEIRNLLVDTVHSLYDYLEQGVLYRVAVELYRDTHQALPKEDPAQPRMLLNIGNFEEKVGNYFESKQHLEESLVRAHEALKRPRETANAAQETDAWEIVISVKRTLGVVALDQCEYYLARMELGEGFTLAIGAIKRGIPSARRLAASLSARRAWVETDCGNDDAAMERTLTGLELAEHTECGDCQIERSELLLNRGILEYHKGEYNEAIEWYKKALGAAPWGDHITAAAARHAMGGAQIQLGEYDVAESNLLWSQGVALEAGHRWYVSLTQKELGELWLRQGKLSDARRAFSRALQLAGELGTRDLMAFGRFGLARVAAQNGDPGEARRLGRTSLEMFEEVGHRKRKEVALWMRALDTFFNGSPSWSLAPAGRRSTDPTIAPGAARDKTGAS